MATFKVNDWLVFGPEYIENIGEVDQVMSLSVLNDTDWVMYKEDVSIPAKQKIATTSLPDALYRWELALLDGTGYNYFIFPNYPLLAHCLSNYQVKLSKEFMITLFYFNCELDKLIGNNSTSLLVPDLDVLLSKKELLDTLLSECEDCQRFCEDNPDQCNPNSKTIV